MDRRFFLKYLPSVPTSTVLLACGGGNSASAEASTAYRRWLVRTADGVVLNVDDVGDIGAKPMLLVHGLSQSSLSFAQQFGSSALRASYRLIGVDLRGHGRSQGALGALDDNGMPLSALPSSAYVSSVSDTATSALWASDVQAAIDGLNLKDPTLVGWSYGAVVVADFVRVNRGLGPVRRAIVTAGTPVLLAPGSGAGSGDLVFGAAVPAAVFPTLDTNPLLTPPGPVDATQVSDGMIKFVRLALADSVPGRTAATREEIVAATTYNIASPPAARQAIVGRSFDFRAEMAALPASVRSAIQVITPLADQVIQAANVRQYWDAAGLSATHVTVPDEGHAYFARNPVAFNARLLSFLG